MEPNTKRIFCGNLPEDITEHSLSKRFKKYGTVHSVEIKKRANGSTFAYLDFETQNDSIQACLDKIMQKQFKGQELKVEIAKESFLNRLAKERNLNRLLADANSKSSNGNDELTSRFIGKNKPSIEINKDVASENDTGSSDEDHYNNGLPMFRGIKHGLHEREKSKDIIDSVSESYSPNTKKVKHKSQAESEAKADSSYEKKERHNNNENERLIFKTNLLNQGNKNFEAEEKRIKSVEHKRAVRSNQLKTIKMALSAVDNPINKKIIFDDANEIRESIVDADQEYVQKTVDSKTSLFDDDIHSSEDDDFRIKTQFEGKKGQKLLELQSRYGSDKRFTLDERFYESDENSNTETETVEDEKQRQIKILESVLGTKVKPVQDKMTNNWKMVRYDPTNPDHKKLELREPHKEKIKNKKVPDIFMEEKCQDYDTGADFLQDKYYKVSDTLKESLKNKDGKTEFSLLKLFDSAEGNGKVDEKDEYQNTLVRKGNVSGWSSNPFKYDSSESEDEEITAVIKSDNLSETKSMEVFFFQTNDIRLIGGLNFFTTAGIIHDSSFAEKRRELKRIVKAKVKKNLKKKVPWKRMIRGKRLRHK